MTEPMLSIWAAITVIGAVALGMATIYGLFPKQIDKLDVLIDKGITALAERLEKKA